MTIVIVAAMGLALSLLALHLASLLLVLPRLMRAETTPNQLKGTPLVTLLRPIKGLEYQMDKALGSSLCLDYPNHEVLFCADDADDPAVPVVRKLIEAARGVDAKLLVGRDPVSHNPKINNLMKGWRAAKGDYVAMADSNIILPPDYIEQLFSPWDAQTGLVSSPAVAVDPKGAGGALECAFMNGYQARWQVAADQLGRGYAQGKTLFWHKAFLDKAGGPAPLGQPIAEDAASTMLVRKAGLKVRLTRRPFQQPVGSRSVRTVWSRQLRWSIIRRVAFPRLFVFEPFSSGVFASVLFAAAASSAGVSPVVSGSYFLMWYGAEWGFVRLVAWPARAGIIAMSVVRDAMIPALWVLAWTRNSFDWQGNPIAETDGGRQ